MFKKSFIRGILYIVALLISTPYFIWVLRYPSYLTGPEALEIFYLSPIIAFALLFPVFLGLAIIELMEAFKEK